MNAAIRVLENALDEFAARAASLRANRDFAWADRDHAAADDIEDALTILRSIPTE